MTSEQLQKERELKAIQSAYKLNPIECTEEYNGSIRCNKICKQCIQDPNNNL